MKKKDDYLMNDLIKLMEKQNFKSEEEVKKFMEGIIGKPIPKVMDEATKNSDIAVDLVHEAYKLSTVKARKNIQYALEMDPDCIEAFELLGSLEPAMEIATAFFEKGISIGRKKFGGIYLKKNKGMFWGLHETRPFMRCMAEYADILFSLDRVGESVGIMEEMIELNPVDNQGIRDQLLLGLVVLGDKERFGKYDKKYKDDIMAFPQFNRALFAFKTEGDSPEAKKKLQKAMESNKYVVPMLLADGSPEGYPEYHGFGDKNEATYYVFFSYRVWRMVPGAIEWLKNKTK